MDECTASFLSGIDAAFLTQLGVVIAGIAALIQTIRGGQTKQAAAAAIGIAQQNRYLETRNALPVTNASPPVGTGNGKVDQAVQDLLPLAAAVPPPVVLPAPAPRLAVVPASPPLDDGLRDLLLEIRDRLPEKPAPAAPPPPTP